MISSSTNGSPELETTWMSVSMPWQTRAREPPTMNITTIGLDVAKHVFQVHGVDAVGEVVARKDRPSRAASAALCCHCEAEGGKSPLNLH
jgi:hypothetical protein